MPKLIANFTASSLPAEHLLSKIGAELCHPLDGEFESELAKQRRPTIVGLTTMMMIVGIAVASFD